MHEILIPSASGRPITLSGGRWLLWRPQQTVNSPDSLQPIVMMKHGPERLAPGRAGGFQECPGVTCLVGPTGLERCFAAESYCGALPQSTEHVRAWWPGREQTAWANTTDNNAITRPKAAPRTQRAGNAMESSSFIATLHQARCQACIECTLTSQPSTSEAG